MEATDLTTHLYRLGYWNTSFFVIIACEHYLFRGGWSGRYEGYDLEAWNTPALMPLGAAGALAFVAGIAGCVLGMSETWYVGVLARKIGDPASGGDIGNELAFLFTLIVFVPARWLEYRSVGR